jgi:hypothetical protein
LANESIANLKGVNEKLQENFLCLNAKHTDLEVEHDLLKESTLDSNDATKSSTSITSNSCTRCSNINVESCATNLAEMHVMKKEIIRLTKLINEDTTSPKIGEFEKHTKCFGSDYMKKYGFVKGMVLGKNEQGHQEPIPFIKNNKISGVGASGAILGGMIPIRSKVDGKQPKASSQVKVNTINTSHASKPKPHASQSSFYADYVLTWDRKGKVVANVGYRTKDTLIKRNVWVPKVLVTNTLGPQIPLGT